MTRRKNRTGDPAKGKPTASASERDPDATTARSSSRVVFNWAHLSRGAANKEFEDLCLDLFREEHGHETFIPGPRRSGRDGSFDGFYEGRVAGHSGRWKIACTVRQKKQTLEPKIEDERLAAVRANCTGLLVMTSADLDVPTVSALNARARRGLKAARVWPRSTLESLLKKHPWVAATYFGHQLMRGFVPLASGPDHELAAQPDLELVGRDAECAKLREFFEGPSRVLLVVAPGGSGKSRLLRELRPMGGRARRAWSRLPGIGTIEEGLLSGLPLGRPLLLVLDDAGRALPDVHQLGHVANDRAAGRDLKVVFAARPVDQDIIGRVLSGVANLARETIELQPLSLDQTVEVIVEDAPRVDQRIAKRIARHFGSNLFLLRAAARLIGSGESPLKVLGDGQLRGLVASRLLTESVRCLNALCDEGKAQQVLLETAIDVPLHRDSLSDEQGALLEAGLLRTVGETVRVRSDVEGDVLLGYLLEQPWARARLHGLLANDPEKLAARVRNLAAAGNGDASKEIRRICQQWLDSATETDRWERRKVLRVLPQCVRAAPQQVIDLCVQYVRTLDAHSTNDFGEIVVALSRVGNPVDALKFLRTLLELGVPDGAYSNYKLPGVAHEIVSFAYVGIEGVASVLHEVSQWVPGEMSASSIRIAEALLARLLSTIVQWNETDGATLSFHERPVAPSESVLAFRERVLGCVGEMLSHGNVQVRLAAASILLEHAHSAGGMAADHPDFKKVQDEEFQRIAPALRTCLDRETSLSVMAKLEEGLVSRWAAQRPGELVSERLLRDVGWPSILAAFRLSSKGWEFYVSIGEVMDAAPSVDRWSWWVNRGAAASYGIPLLDVERVTDRVQADYPGDSGIVEVVHALDDAKRPEIFLDAWCAKDPNGFLRALDSDLSSRSRERIRRAVQRHTFASLGFDIASEVQRHVVDGATLETIQQVLDDARAFGADAAVAVAKMFVSADALDRRLFGLNVIRHRQHVVAKEAALDVLATAVRDGVWLEGWDTIWSLLHDADLELRQKSGLVDLLEARLVGALSSDAWRNAEEWHVDALLTQLLRVDGRRRGRMLGEIVGTAGSGSDSVAKLAAPLVANAATLKSLLVGFGERIGNGSVRVDLFERVLGGAAGLGLPSDCPAIARLCLSSASGGVRRAGVALLTEMRGSQHGSAACAMLAELAVSNDELREVADRQLWQFTNPRNGWSGAVGEPAPAFVRIQKSLETAMSRVASPKARARIAVLQRSVAASIQRQLRSDEEFLDPR